MDTFFWIFFFCISQFSKVIQKNISIFFFSFFLFFSFFFLFFFFFSFYYQTKQNKKKMSKRSFEETTNSDKQTAVTNQQTTNQTPNGWELQKECVRFTSDPKTFQTTCSIDTTVGNKDPNDEKDEFDLTSNVKASKIQTSVKVLTPMMTVQFENLGSKDGKIGFQHQGSSDPSFSCTMKFSDIAYKPLADAFPANSEYLKKFEAFITDFRDAYADHVVSCKHAILPAAREALVKAVTEKNNQQRIETGTEMTNPQMKEYFKTLVLQKMTIGYTKHETGNLLKLNNKCFFSPKDASKLPKKLPDSVYDMAATGDNCANTEIERFKRGQILVMPNVSLRHGIHFNPAKEGVDRYNPKLVTVGSVVQAEISLQPYSFLDKIGIMVHLSKMIVIHREKPAVWVAPQMQTSFSSWKDPADNEEDPNIKPLPPMPQSNKPDTSSNFIEFSDEDLAQIDA